MRKSRWLVAASICSIVVMPAITSAQADSTNKDPQDFVRDVLHALLGPHWNMFADGGIVDGTRYLLQSAANPADGKRALESATGYDVGLGAGVDILLRTGLRASFTFGSSNMNFRTSNGNGSSALNIDDVGRLKTQTAALELIHYMLPWRATINPYGTVGIQGTWWTLKETSPYVTGVGADTPFTVSPLLSFGVQIKPSHRWSARVEAVLSSQHNPFTGNRSFRSLVPGSFIDEENSVGHTEYRLAAVYHFGKSNLPGAPVPVAHK